MALLTLALLIDLIVGDPDWLWRRVPHPVVLIGKLIDWFEKQSASQGFSMLTRAVGISRPQNQLLLLGCSLLIAFLLIAILVARIVSNLGMVGWLIELLLVTILLAQRSLYNHVADVANALKTEGLSAARQAVALIVGRDVSQLDESGVSKASIESLAENFSDGVVAPALWYLIGGLPGILFYKAVNTADSMIGHHNERYEYFGKPAAKLDDWLNWPAARLSSAIVVVAVLIGHGGSAAGNVWSATVRDASSHRSPNAGWPETSFAAALNLTLGGARSYDGDAIEAATLYPEGREIARTADIDKSLSLFLTCCICLIGACGLLWLAFG
ncbi:MAG: adenosylcobinamide-phosphate synthase CbiB [Rhizobiaceae bacterium]